MFTTKWRRVILDEAHCIRSKKTVSASACFWLDAERRWCITGTPIQNSVGDIYSLCRFLQFQPFCRDDWFKNLVSMPVRKKTTAGFGILKAILRCACLRRLKTMKLGGREILTLPETSRFICNVEMVGEERARYDALETESKHLYHEAVQNDTMRQIYPHIFEVLTRMRQVCAHYKLIRNRRIDIAMAQLPADIASDPKKVELARKLYSILIANEEFEDCAVCLEKVTETHAVITECAHIFCEGCIDQVINVQHKCPICRHHLTKSNVLRSPPPVPEEEEEDYEDDDVVEIVNSTKHESSAKIITMLKLLKKIREEGPEDKIIIVSQWTSMLSIVEKFLTEPFCRYDGAMTRLARDDVIDSFQNTTDGPKILLLSLKAGSLGLNLTAANRMILIDPWYNPAVEQQAIDRINRIGQIRNVFVYRLIVKNSIEERILALQESKLELHKEAFREDLNMNSKQMRLARIRKLVGE